MGVGVCKELEERMYGTPFTRTTASIFNLQRNYRPTGINDWTIKLFNHSLLLMF
jgi:hypothetical protein